MFFAITVAVAEQNPVDSLKKILTTQADNSNKVDVLIELSIKYRSTSPDTAMDYALQAKALAEKINYAKVAVRKSQTNPQGGIVQMEKTISASNVKLVCPRCSKPTRIAYTLLADGTKQRSCKLCHELLGV